MKKDEGPCQIFLREHMNYGSDDCLIWPFFRDLKGRGLARIGGRQIPASRAMCLFAHGEPPTPKHEAAHSCGAGHLGCVNPRHLRWATKIENEADKDIHDTRAKGERNGHTRLSDADISAIRADCRFQRLIAADFGITQSTVSFIRHRKTWRHVQ